MKIVAISDLHGDLPALPEGDLLIIGGDVCPVSDHSDAFQRSWLTTNFTQWLEEQPFERIVGIAGNHDFVLERYPSLARELPWTYLLDTPARYQGVTIWGTPWVPNLSRWAFHQDDAGLDRKFDAIPDDTDILISHGPARGYLDFTVPKFGSVYAGAPSLNPTLRRVKPKLFFCGHIHEGYGTAVHPSGTVMYNCARMTENYEPINEPWVIQYEH